MTPKKLIIITSILLFICAIVPFIKRGFTEETITVTITDKGIKRNNDSDIYLVYTDNGTYEITDTIAYWRWNSSDLYGEIEIGKTYEMTVCGWRIPFLSAYQNIIEVTEISK